MPKGVRFYLEVNSSTVNVGEVVKRKKEDNKSSESHACLLLLGGMRVIRLQMKTGREMSIR